MLIVVCSMILFGCTPSVEEEEVATFNTGLTPIDIKVDLSKTELTFPDETTSVRLSVQNNRNDNSLVYITVPDVSRMNKIKFQSIHEFDLYGTTDEDGKKVFEIGQSIDNLPIGELKFRNAESMDELYTELVVNACSKYSDKSQGFVCVNKDVCDTDTFYNFEYLKGGPVRISEVKFYNKWFANSGELYAEILLDNVGNGFVYTSDSYKDACINVVSTNGFKRHAYNVKSVKLQGRELECRETLFKSKDGQAKVICSISHSYLAQPIEANINQRFFEVEYEYNYKEVLNTPINYRNERLLESTYFDE